MISDIGASAHNYYIEVSFLCSTLN